MTIFWKIKVDNICNILIKHALLIVSNYLKLFFPWILKKDMHDIEALHCDAKYAYHELVMKCQSECKYISLVIPMNIVDSYLN